eukprot:TRINITY_DN22661_c1_g4_i1.p1 TRINITY_DN22661_c1_g4~~TRINITY_DN22661_c1_g4_i1.p1  ORF type:complete len:265 (-),score=45.94 TRINITY_DN22661_c1_g4_i1:169-963(-)
MMIDFLSIAKAEFVAATRDLGHCAPSWKVQAMECPYGHESGMLSGKFTWPVAPDLAQYAAMFYSFSPVIMLFLPLVCFLVTRGVRELICMAYVGYAALVTLPLKAIVQQARPIGSCLTSCGMPSGHSMLGLGFFTWFAMEVFSKNQKSTQQKALLLAAAGVLLLPIPWSRVALHDHSLQQVIVGSCVGLIMTIPWYYALQSRVTLWGMKLVKAHVPILNFNYPLEGLEEEAAWTPQSSDAAGGYGTMPAAKASDEKAAAHNTGF